MFKILSKIVNGTKGAIVASLEGVTDISTTTINAVKKITVNTLKETGDLLKEGIQVPGAIVKGSLIGIGEIGSSVVKAVKGVVDGVTTVGGDSAKATFTAVKTILTVAQEFGDETLTQVKDALSESVKGAKDIINEFEK